MLAFDALYPLSLGISNIHPWGGNQCHYEPHIKLLVCFIFLKITMYNSCSFFWCYSLFITKHLFCVLFYHSTSCGGTQMTLTLSSLGLSLRMLNCVPFCQSREQRYIVVICRITVITFTVAIDCVKFVINYFAQLQLKGVLAK